MADNRSFTFTDGQTPQLCSEDFTGQRWAAKRIKGGLALAQEIIMNLLGTGMCLLQPGPAPAPSTN